MYDILIICDIIIAVALISVILLQQSKGADAGMSFNPSSGNLLGVRGASNFLTKLTTILAILFFVCSLIIGRLSSAPVSVDENIGIMAPVNEEKSDIPD